MTKVELNRRHFLGLLGGGAISLALPRVAGAQEESADNNNDALELYDFSMVTKLFEAQGGGLELRVTIRVTYQDTGVEEVRTTTMIVGDTLELSGQLVTDLWRRNG